MDTQEKIALAQQILGCGTSEVRVLKSDNGLIERTDKTILTSDNRELLMG